MNAPSFARLSSRPARQSGVTLFVGLVMLLLMSLAGMTQMRMVTTSMQVVNNELFTDEARAAAACALDQAVSSSDFIDKYAEPTVVKCDLGQAAYQAVVAHAGCLSYKPLTTDDLKEGPPGDETIPKQYRPCVSGADQSGTVTISRNGGMSAGSSLCADAAWELSSQAKLAEDSGLADSGAVATLLQGVAARVTVADAATCR